MEQAGGKDLTGISKDVMDRYLGGIGLTKPEVLDFVWHDLFKVNSKHDLLQAVDLVNMVTPNYVDVEGLRQRVDHVLDMRMRKGSAVSPQPMSGVGP